MARTSLGIAAGLAFLIPLLPGAPAAAGGGGDDHPAPSPGALEVRLHDVGALVLGRAQLDGEAGPFRLADHSADDAESAHFDRAEGDERVRPFGGIEDVIERVKTTAGAPGDWEREGVSISALGPDRLVVRGPAALQESVTRILGGMEADDGGTVTLDLMVVEGSPAAAQGEGGVPAGIRAGHLRIVSGVRTTGQLAHRVTAFAGRQRAFLIDQDVEVAQEAKTSDPVVGVQPEGFATQVYVDAVVPRLVLDVRAWGARVIEERSVTTAHGDTVELPQVDGWSVVAQVRPKAGEWTLLPIFGDRSLAVRATRRPAPARKPAPPLPSVAGGSAQDSVVSRSFPCTEFGSMIPNRVGPRIGLTPSHAVDAEPDQPGESFALLPGDAFKELLQNAIDPESWTWEGRSLEVVNGVLLVRHDARHVEGVEALLAPLRAQVVNGFRFRAALVRLPLSSFPEWANGLGDGADLCADGGAALLARPGAVLLDRGAVRTTRNGRNAVFGGAVRRYVRDYDVSIAQQVFLGNAVPGEVPVGLSLDVSAGSAAGGAAVACEVRLDRSTWDGARTVRTTHGDVDCPTLGLLRLRAGTLVPLGETRLVGVAVDGETATLVLLTANAD